MSDNKRAPKVIMIRDEGTYLATDTEAREVEQLLMKKEAEAAAVTTGAMPELDFESPEQLAWVIDFISKHPVRGDRHYVHYLKAHQKRLVARIADGANYPAIKSVARRIYLASLETDQFGGDWGGLTGEQKYPYITQARALHKAGIVDLSKVELSAVEETEKANRFGSVKGVYR